MTSGIAEIAVWFAGFNLGLGAAGMYSVYWIQERSLALGYGWAGVLAVTVPMAEIMYVPWPFVRYAMTVTGLAGVAVVAWGWEPVFDEESKQNRIDTRSSHRTGTTVDQQQ